MRLERLIIEAGENSFTLDLHPRLTVVAGMGAIERTSLIGEIVGALGGSRDGVHLEFEDRGGRHLTIFRPPIGQHRVVDVDRGQDVTTDVCGIEGVCDLLQTLGLDVTSAHRAMRVSPEDLATSSDRGKAVEALAAVDQRRLWAAAEALAHAEGDLATEAKAVGSMPGDLAVIDLVEARHAAVERATSRFEGTRKRTFLISGASTVVTLPAVFLAGVTGLGLLAIAALSVVASFAARRTMLKAGAAEELALAQAGAQTYLGFQLQRVNTLLGDDSSRRTLMDAADHRREALADWRRLAVDIPVEWALENREEIEAAANLRKGADALGALTSSAGDQAADELARALATRLAAARSVAGEGLPLLVDDAFDRQAVDVKLRLLELLGRSAGDPQIVFLTEDPDVTAWARLEALAGDLSLIEPVPEHDRNRDDAITI